MKKAYLHLNIQYANISLLSHILHGLDARPVKITVELCMFDESPLAYKLCELFLRGEIVFAAILLAFSRLPSCVYASLVSEDISGWAGAVRTIRETEKPNVLGWAAKSRLRIVDFPEPEGPEMTIGRCFWVAKHIDEFYRTHLVLEQVTSGYLKEPSW